MKRNDIILLNELLKQKKAQISINDSDFFELFTFEQILKNFDLSVDEIKGGKVGGGDDGGIDGFFILLDGDLLSEKILNIDRIRKNPDIDLYIIQSKNTDSFREDVFAKLLASSKDIFNLHKSNTDLKKNYNTTLVEKISIFRSTYRDLLSKYPNLKIFFCYASKGNCNRIHVKVKEISKKLIDEVKKYLPSSLVEIKFYGARELLDISRKEKPYTLEMDFFENLSRGKNDYLILSSLYNYYNFIKDENSNLRKYLFESNVRDYYGKNEVNKDIIETINKLDSQGLEGDIDFWWLNNGITILASKAAISGKTIVLDNVLIVNGLQTTRCLYDCLKNSSQSLLDSIKEKAILIKIIINDNAIVRDKIIKATNFQTSMPVASLRATDELQRDIEDHLHNNGWYYDRRKNYYKNLNKPITKIISIPYLAQSMTAINLKEPHISRGRPSSIIKDDNNYKKIFNKELDIKIYLICLKIMKKIEDIIETEFNKDELPKIRNLRFHIAMISVMKIIKNVNYGEDKLLRFNLAKLKKKNIKRIALKILKIAESKSRNGNSLDKIAKSKEFSTYLIENIFRIR